MKKAWQAGKSDPRKVCDFAVFRDHGCVLVDANMRSLPQSFAEGSATVESLEKEIRERFTTTKFQQLLSTIDQFMELGWDDAKVPLSSRTRFVPVVVVPDSGIPSELMMENAMFNESLPMVLSYNDNPNFYRVHVPAVLTFRDLLVLEGLAARGVDVFTLLKRWRNIHPFAGNGRQPLPVPLREFVEERYGAVSMSEAEHRLGWDMFEHLRLRFERVLINAAPPLLRESRARLLAQIRANLPTFE
ncbi:hypothetical protein [Gordonia alkanivorans]|uniref:hypothetical protein n=1 Tax=Gordonia alkanivorans TaxID=84096 RepID=UPI0013E3D004|nr:hypothetical protein [Gordonia alkanivorans]